MGSQNSGPVKGMGHFDESEWVQVTPNIKNYEEKHGNFLSYRHSITNEEIDQYELHFATDQQALNYYDCFLMRIREDYIVNTIHYRNTSLKEFCTTLHRAQVYVQHIAIRLSDITDIPYPENIYILRNCLFGFQQLYDFIGYFQPHDDLVCIDNYGEVKVWMNSDLSKNFPEDYGLPETQKPEFMMVNTLITLIEDNTDLKTCPMPISQHFSDNDRLFPTFKDALQIIDEYVFKFSTNVPQYCESVIEIFKDPQSPSSTCKDD